MRFFGALKRNYDDTGFRRLAFDNSGSSSSHQEFAAAMLQGFPRYWSILLYVRIWICHRDFTNHVSRGLRLCVERLNGRGADCDTLRTDCISMVATLKKEDLVTHSKQRRTLHASRRPPLLTLCCRFRPLSVRFKNAQEWRCDTSNSGSGAASQRNIEVGHFEK